MRAKNEVRELPRSYLDHKVSKHEARARWVHAGHTLLHDLKENVVTPYVDGGIPGLVLQPTHLLFGKTLWPSFYRRWTAWLRRLFVPSLATTLTVDKLAPAETAEMLDAEQQALVRKVLRERLGLRGSRPTPELVEASRPRIDKLIARHEVLQHFYDNEWVHLVALDLDEQVWYRYRPTG